MGPSTLICPSCIISIRRRLPKNVNNPNDWATEKGMSVHPKITMEHGSVRKRAVARASPNPNSENVGFLGALRDKKESSYYGTRNEFFPPNVTWCAKSHRQTMPADKSVQHVWMYVRRFPGIPCFSMIPKTPQTPGLAPFQCDD